MLMQWCCRSEAAEQGSVLALSAHIAPLCAGSCSLALLQLPADSLQGSELPAVVLTALQESAADNETAESHVATLLSENTISLHQLDPDTAWELHLQCRGHCQPTTSFWQLQPAASGSAVGSMLVKEVSVARVMPQTAAPERACSTCAAPEQTHPAAVHKAKPFLQLALLAAALLVPVTGCTLITSSQ